MAFVSGVQAVEGGRTPQLSLKDCLPLASDKFTEQMREETKHGEGSEAGLKKVIDLCEFMRCNLTTKKG